MKNEIIVLGDVHIGARNASPVVCEYQLSFFENELFPYMESHGIKTILQLGDLFDSRKFSNHVIFHNWKNRFFDVIEKRGYALVVLLGNHDIASKNSLEVNTPHLLLKSYSSVTVIDKPTQWQFFGVDVDIVPWVCDSNEKEVEEFVKRSSSLYCVGHFEFEGFEMQKGVIGSGHQSPKIFDTYDLVISGHYHTRSSQKNIVYAGVPYEMTWADFDDQKGFHVFNMRNGKLDFVPTKSTLFRKIKYDDSKKNLTVPSDLKGNYVKVIVVNKTDPYKFENYISAILEQSVSDLKISEVEIGIDDVEFDDDLKMDDTKTLITNFVDQVETDLDKQKIKNEMHSIYLHALEVTD